MNTQLSERLTFPTQEGYFIVSVGEIVHCAADGNYSSIYLANGSELVICRKIGQLEAILPPDHFMRVHHSHLVNMLFLKKYLHKDGGQLLMANGRFVPVSRRRKPEVMQRFKSV